MREYACCNSLNAWSSSRLSFFFLLLSGCKRRQRLLYCRWISFCVAVEETPRMSYGLLLNSLLLYDNEKHNNCSIEKMSKRCSRNDDDGYIMMLAGQQTDVPIDAHQPTLVVVFFAGCYQSFSSKRKW